MPCASLQPTHGRRVLSNWRYGDAWRVRVADSRTIYEIHGQGLVSDCQSDDFLSGKNCPVAGS